MIAGEGSASPLATGAVNRAAVGRADGHLTQKERRGRDEIRAGLAVTTGQLERLAPGGRRAAPPATDRGWPG